jgi:histidine phosphotransferase ChpT
LAFFADAVYHTRNGHRHGDSLRWPTSFSGDSMSGMLERTGPLSVDSMDLAALLCSRVCHDLISPVGAIVNGLEVLEDNNDEETKTFALALIKKSARQASAKLQFCRLAFGASGSSGAQVDLGDGQAVARGFLEDDKTKLIWNLPRLLWPKNKVKLVLNLLLIAGQTIPRGGTLTIDPIGEGDAMTFAITAAGLNARIPQAVPALVAGEPVGHGVDAHGIQPFYAGMLARACNLAVSVVLEGDKVLVSARPDAATPAAA